MATKSVAKASYRRFAQSGTSPSAPVLRSKASSPCVCRHHGSRLFTSSAKLRQNQYKDSFGTRLRKALGETKIKWYPIPAVLGIGFLGLGQAYRVNEREKARLADEWEDDGYVKSTGSGGDSEREELRGRPKRRERIRPTGPWFVTIMFINGWIVTDIYQANPGYVNITIKGDIKGMGKIQ